MRIKNWLRNKLSKWATGFTATEVETMIEAWEQMCEKYGINEWCLNEGRADSDDTIEVSLEDAEHWGLVEAE